MAVAGQSIENPVTGQRILFLTSARENGGTRWEVEWFIQPHRGRFPPAHMHPAFPERFEILAGSARYRVGRQEYAVRAGEVITLPAGIGHLHPWSVSDQELHMRQTFRLPQANLQGLQATEGFFETLFGLARDGKVGRNGLPNLLQFLVLAHSGSPLTYAPDIPIQVQEISVGAMAALGRLLGYRARYPRYSGPEEDIVSHSTQRS